MPAQSALFYKSEFSQRNLVFESSTTTISNTQAQAQGSINSVITPPLIWENGRSHFVFSDATPTTGGRKFILTYDERYGLGRPIGFGGSNPDSHHRPAILKYNSKLYITSETNHNTAPIGIWASDVNDEAMYMDQSASTIGTAPTYPNPNEKNGIFTLLNQTNDVNAAYSKNSDGDFEGTWTTEELIATRQANEDELYVSSATNMDVLPNEVVFIICGRNDDTATPTWFNKYIIRAEVTAGGITYYNWTKTFSTTSTISAANMAAQYQYYTTGGDTNQGYIPVLALDKLGNFYDISGDGSGGYDFVYLINGQSSPTVKAISLPSSPTILDRAAVGGEGQAGGCVYLVAETPREVYAFFRIDEGGDGKIYMYKTTDLGDTWTFVVDVFDDVSADFEGFALPNNTADIPGSRNFIAVGTKVESPKATLYVKRAAWGSIQTDDTQGYYDDATAYTASEYDALMLRSYYVEAGKVTNTGTTLNTCIDQSPSAQDATSTGSPVMDSSTTPTFLTFDGSNDALTVPATGLTALTEGTIIIVAKPTSGVNNNFLTFSRNSASPWQGFGKSSGNLTRFIDDTSTIIVEGSTTVTSNFHIFVFLLQNGRGAVLHFLDGELQYRTETTPSTLEGRFTSALSTIDRVSIGRLFRNTTNYYAFDFKHCAIMGSPMNTEQLKRSMKYLANKYSITLTDHFD